MSKHKFYKSCREASNLRQLPAATYAVFKEVERRAKEGKLSTSVDVADAFSIEEKQARKHLKLLLECNFIREIKVDERALKAEF